MNVNRIELFVFCSSFFQINFKKLGKLNLILNVFIMNNVKNEIKCLKISGIT